MSLPDSSARPTSLCIHLVEKLVSKFARQDEGRLEGDQAAFGGAVVQNFEHQLRGRCRPWPPAPCPRRSLETCSPGPGSGSAWPAAPARTAAVVEQLAHDLEIGLARSNTALSPPIMNVSVRLFGAGLRAGAGRIEKVRSLGGERLRRSLGSPPARWCCNRRRSRRSRTPSMSPFCADGDFARHVGIADAIENEVGVLGDFLGRGAGVRLALFRKLLRLRAVFDHKRHFVAGVSNEGAGPWDIP